MRRVSFAIAVCFLSAPAEAASLQPGADGRRIELTGEEGFREATPTSPFALFVANLFEVGAGDSSQDSQVGPSALSGTGSDFSDGAGDTSGRSRYEIDFGVSDYAPFEFTGTLHGQLEYFTVELRDPAGIVAAPSLDGYDLEFEEIGVLEPGLAYRLIVESRHEMIEGGVGPNEWSFDFAIQPTASPPFETPLSELDAAIRCSGPLDAPGPDPVLLVHGTANDHSQYAWNWEPALAALGIPFCTVDLLDFGEGDIQLSAERVVHAILSMHVDSGDRIDVIGHSQGGMIPRWALKYWPETRLRVDDVVAHAPSNHGTPVAGGTCGGGSCPEAEWQQRDVANFLSVLNEGPEAFPEPDYTVVYTLTDEVVTPQAGPNASSPLRGGGANVRNVALQDVCPNDLNEHLAIGTYDPVAYALTIDALQNPGPADPTRIPPTVCAELFMPGVDPTTFAEDFAATTALIGEVRNNHPPVSEEPPIKAYALPEPGASSGLAAGVLALWALGRRPNRPLRS